MSSNSLNAHEETGKGSYWAGFSSGFSSKFQDLKQKAKSKGSEIAGYANQQSRNIMSRIKKEEPVQPEVEKERHVFGVPLKYVMENSGHENGIPLIVYQCINELAYSIDEVGLYRIPGSNHQVEVLRDKYDFLEPVDLSGENPNTVATLLKLFLRLLPNKLIDDEHNIKLNDIIRKCSIEKPEEFNEFNEVAEVLEDLPGWEYNLIGYICFHLKSVADNAKYNKMNINNLGLIFCPTLKISPAVFSILVIHSQSVFRRFLSNEEAYGEDGEYNPDYDNENYNENSEYNSDYNNENEDNTDAKEQQDNVDETNTNENNTNENNTNEINTKENDAKENNTKENNTKENNTKENNTKENNTKENSANENNVNKSNTNESKTNENNTNEESNFADFDNNQEVLKLNSNFEVKEQNTKSDENTSDTLINSEEENKTTSS